MAKIDRKIAVLSLYIFVPCMNIQGEETLLSAVDAHVYGFRSLARIMHFCQRITMHFRRYVVKI